MATSKTGSIPDKIKAASKAPKPNLNAVRPGMDIIKPAVREPIKVMGEGPRDDVQALKKSSEERAYYIMYYNLETEEYKWKKFIGRKETYFGLRDILDAESVDLKLSKVLVEVVGIDAITNEARVFLTDFASAPNLIKFHAMMEPFFGSNAWSMGEYDYGYSIAEDDDQSETDVPRVPKIDKSGNMSSEQISVQDSFYRSQENFQFQTEDTNGIGAFLSKEERDAILNQVNDVTPTEYLNGVEVKSI